MSLIETYLARTPGSRELFERATRSIPGGSTRTTVFNPPYPPYMVRGEGLRTWDVDGNEYRDFLGNYTSLVLGHGHPDVVAAVEAQVRRGSAFAAPTEVEIELAEEIRRPDQLGAAVPGRDRTFRDRASAWAAGTAPSYRWS